MGLEGSIEEFGLADILQLLYFQKKTGILTVEGRLGRIRIYFYEGNVISAESKRKREEQRLGKILVKKGYLTDKQLNEMLVKKKSSKERLGTLLISSGLVNKETIEEIITNQLTEIVVQLFNWKTGTYDFKPQKMRLDKNLPISIDTQHLLMDGLRIVDELSIVEGKINLDTVFQKTRKREENLSDDDNNVLGLIDGESDVSTVIEVAGMDDFDVSKILVSLMDRGLIEVVQQKEFVISKKDKKALDFRFPVLSIVTTLIILVSCLISLNPLFKQSEGMKFLRAGKELQKIRLALEVAKYSTGSYPETVQSVIAAQNDPWGNPYIYRTTMQGYELKSTGPDGILNTPDDIYL